MIRNRLNSELKDAMRARDQLRLATLRLVTAAIKDRDIAARSEENSEGVSDVEISQILQKMVRQREESAATYEEAGRLELAEQERAEIDVIRPFLPKPMTDEDVAAAISAAIQDTGASSVRDMGKIMAALKAKYAGKMDFGKVNRLVKAALG